MHSLFIVNCGLVEMSRLQTECSHYRMVAEEAYKHITDIQGKDVLSRSQELRLKDWLELLEEVCVVNWINI